MGKITKAVTVLRFHGPLYLLRSLYSLGSSFSWLVQCKIPPRCLSKIFLSFPPFRRYLRQCSSNFLPLCSRALSRRIQYVSCAYARKFKYLLFVIKFGGARGMGILHRDCAMQRDRPSLFVRGNGDLHIDRYFIFLRVSSLRYIALASIRLSFSISRFRSVRHPTGNLGIRVVLRNILVLPSSPFNSYT